jgi:hypothetical protein
MVSYQTMVAIAYEVAKAKGATFSGIEDGGDFISQLSTVWQDNKAELKQATQQQTADILSEIIRP